MHFVFGDHVLDPARRELRRGAELIEVEPQVFDLLLHLIRNRDRGVSKDDLLDTIWQGRIVADSTISSRIAAARRAGGDGADRHRLIRTIARRGIRCAVKVCWLGGFAIPYRLRFPCLFLGNRYDGCTAGPAG